MDSEDHPKDVLVVDSNHDNHSMSISHAGDHEDESSAMESSDGASATTKRSIDDEIARRQQHVAYTRCAALFLVLATAVAAGVTTYIFTSRDEQAILKQLVYEMNDEVLTTSLKHFFEITNFLEDMSISMSALATSSNVSWPYYTQFNFATSFGQAYLENAGASLISWSPIVQGELQRIEWGQYSTEYASEWIPSEHLANEIPSMIHYKNEEGLPVMEQSSGPFLPVWQLSIPIDGHSPSNTTHTIDPSAVNYNILANDLVAKTFDVMMTKNEPALSMVIDATEIYGHSLNNNVPTSLLLTPIYANAQDSDATVIGSLVSVLPWTLFYQEILHPSQPKLTVVVEQPEACGQSLVFTIEVDGEWAHYVGPGNQVPENYLEYGTTRVATGLQISNDNGCYFTIGVYPTDETIAAFDGEESAAAIWTSIVVLVILFAGFVFFAYDYAVQRRMMKTMNSAAKTNAVLASLFPTEVRDRLVGKKPKSGQDRCDTDDSIPMDIPIPESTKYRLKNYLAGVDNAAIPASDEKVQEAIAGIDMHDTKPIAELFPNTTVMFADIAGFTAWSSVREPSQVFVLLETVYRAFDNIAKKRKVFKVETVGDCYVAVAGLPEARPDHALVMAKFAKECLEKFNELSKHLEISLGPDTGDLAMRAGLHSGPVTAGVLRGDRSRFQLFGETVNTAARVESTGFRNQVHLSSDTAKLLIDAGKEHWIKKREDLVTAKGKGALQTYWLVTPGLLEGMNNDAANPESAHRVGLDLNQLEASLPPKIQRLVMWNVEILKRLLQQIIAKRNAMPSGGPKYEIQLTKLEESMDKRKQLIEEVTEIIALPKFDPSAHKNQADPSKVTIPEEVLKELKLYVCSIASMHRDNYFHNFEHASHVTMSVSKLLSRIVAPSEIIDKEGGDLASALHDHTFGITSDPLSQFSMVLSALIHDTDHLGVSNAQLVKENHDVAKFHKGQSVAEQNSVVLAWTKLMDPSFMRLRRAIYGTPDELQRFRQIVVNNVLATDIFDKELQTIRKNRWDKAFAAGTMESTDDKDSAAAINRKATIVMEHLIQASDVSHTMQHWHIFRKWNERLFAEMNTAYENGRLGFDPKAGWFQGELGFFDNYIIPLAKKLKECGVFGVSCDEYLNYALENRREWASKGESVVEQYIEKYCKPSKDAEGKNDEEK